MNLRSPRRPSVPAVVFLGLAVGSSLGPADWAVAAQETESTGLSDRERDLKDSFVKMLAMGASPGHPWNYGEVDKAVEQLLKQAEPQIAQDRVLAVQHAVVLELSEAARDATARASQAAPSQAEQPAENADTGATGGGGVAIPAPPGTPPAQVETEPKDETTTLVPSSEADDKKATETKNNIITDARVSEVRDELQRVNQNLKLYEDPRLSSADRKAALKDWVRGKPNSVRFFTFLKEQFDLEDVGPEDLTDEDQRTLDDLIDRVVDAGGEAPEPEPAAQPSRPSAGEALEQVAGDVLKLPVVSSYVGPYAELAGDLYTLAGDLYTLAGTPEVQGFIQEIEQFGGGLFDGGGWGLCHKLRAVDRGIYLAPSRGFGGSRGAVYVIDGY